MPICKKSETLHIYMHYLYKKVTQDIETEHASVMLPFLRFDDALSLVPMISYVIIGRQDLPRSRKF